MAEGDGVNGEEMTTSVTQEKVKLFCSHGGKILPRPSDGTLKYVGGETRVVAVPRSITFSELMKKINVVFDGEYVLKFQIASEDLDSLVTVKSDEDIYHLLDEYNRLEREGGTKIRTFLFPSKPAVMESHPQLPFIDTINGIVRPMNLNLKPPPSTTCLKSFSHSPTDGSSPQSLSPRSVAHNPSVNQDNSLINSPLNRLARVHRVKSSPSLSSLGGNQQASGTTFANSYIHQQPHFHYCPSQRPQHHHHAYISPSMAQDHHMRSHRGHRSPTAPQDCSSHSHHCCQSPSNLQDHHVLPSPQSLFGGFEYGRLSFSHASRGHQNLGYRYPMLRAYPGSGGHSRWGHLEQYATAACGNSQLRAGSPDDA